MDAMILLLGLLAAAVLVVLLWPRGSRCHRPSRVVQELDARAAVRHVGPFSDVTELDSRDAPAEREPGGVCLYTAQTDPFACLVRSTGKRRD